MKIDLSERFAAGLVAALEKVNPWHDAEGKFTTPDKALASGKTPEKFFADKKAAKTWRKVAGNDVSPDALTRNLLLVEGMQGLRVGAVSITPSDVESVAYVRGDIGDREGYRVGSFLRGLYLEKGERIAKHIDFKMSMKGKGMATLVNDRLEAVYRRMGVKNIHLHAVDDGVVAWPKEGYDFADEERKQSAMHRLAGELERAGAKLDREKFLSRPLPAWRIVDAQFKGKPVGENVLRWLGAVDLVKRLEPGDPGFEHGRKYFAMKKQEIARRRIGVTGGAPEKVLKSRGDESKWVDAATVELAFDREMEGSDADRKFREETRRKSIRESGFDPDHPELWGQ